LSLRHFAFPYVAHYKAEQQNLCAEQVKAQISGERSQFPFTSLAFSSSSISAPLALLVLPAPHSTVALSGFQRSEREHQVYGRDQKYYDVHSRGDKKPNRYQPYRVGARGHRESLFDGSNNIALDCNLTAINDNLSRIQLVLR